VREKEREREKGREKESEHTCMGKYVLSLQTFWLKSSACSVMFIVGLLLKPLIPYREA